MTKELTHGGGPSGLQFVLRHYLPENRFAEQLAELVRHSRQYGIEEVLFMPHGLGVNGSPSGYWGSDELAADWGRMDLAREALEEAGIHFSIGIWHTIGHRNRGHSWAPEFSFQPLVDETGVDNPSNACPLCPQWRSHYLQVLAGSAATRPARLFLDDDLRWFHHQTRFNCFCPLHIDAFNQKYGLTYDRETLLSYVVQPGIPHPARRQWFELLQAQMVELVSEFERTVHAISPETQLGMMSSLPDSIAMEGREWEPLMRALAGPDRPLLYRTYYPCYQEIPAREMPRSLAVHRQIMSEIPDDVEVFAELDNCYPTEFNQSPGHMMLRMFLAALCGSQGFHFSLFGFHGNADTFERSREYGAMLEKFRQSWETIATVCAGRPKTSGIRLPTHPDRVRARELKAGKSIAEFALDSLSWAGPLQLAGLPVTFEPSWASALTADALAGHTNEELQTLLSNWVLLDASAVEWLHARGWGEWLGTRDVTGPLQRNEIQAEEVVAEDDPQFGSYFEHKPISTPSPEAQWTLAPEAQELTRLRGYEHKDFGPGAFQFKNSHGGQIEAVPLYSASLPLNPFLTRYRLDGLKRRLLQAAQLRGEAFFVVESPPNTLPLLLEYSGQIILAVTNLRSESCSQMSLRGVHLPEFESAIVFHEGTLRPLSFRQEPDSDGTVRLVAKEEVPSMACVLFGKKWPSF